MTHCILVQQVLVVAFKLRLAREIIYILMDQRKIILFLHHNKKVQMIHSILAQQVQLVAIKLQPVSEIILYLKRLRNLSQS